MSYSIFYRAMFVKMNDGTYIPIIESGDNNVWDVDRNRRSRDWSSCRWMHESKEQRKLYSIPEKDILAAAQHEVEVTLERHVGVEPPFGGKKYTEEDVLSDLGYFNCIKVSGKSTTSARDFLNFVKSGFRNAVSWDDLREIGGSIYLGWYEKDGPYRREYAKDEEELSGKWTKCLNEGITPWIGLTEWDGGRLWNRVRERNRRPRPERKTPSEFFIISFTYQEVERYLVRLTSRNLKFNPWRDRAYKYSSRESAEKAIESISRRFSQVSNLRIWRVAA